MVSTNHFRGRRLSRTLRAPISPRKPHAAAAAAEPPPILAGVIWGCTCDNGLGPATIPVHQAFPTLISPDTWQEVGLTQEGDAYRLTIFFTDPVGPNNIAMDVEQFGSFNGEAGITDWFWDGVSTVVFGPEAWQDFGGAPVGTLTIYLPFP